LTAPLKYITLTNKQAQVVALFILVFALNATPAFGQNIDLDHLGNNVKTRFDKKNVFKISGGLSANTIFYTGNSGSYATPLSYYLNGNLNVSVYGVSVPISFSYSNSGFSYTANLPRAPRRLSLHPKYKWITGHIGDISMTFSPYTLNGMLFSGAGVDIAPNGRHKISAIFGRIFKAVPYDTANLLTPAAYERWGYGVKYGYDKGPFKYGVSYFQAKDKLNSLSVKPDSLHIYPQQNSAISFDLSLPLLKNMVWQSNFGLSVLTQDIRSPKYSDTVPLNWFIKFFGGRQSTNMYKAYKTELSYVVGSSKIGFGIERVDPGYQTLGAYYFNNDMENITANFAQSLFKGKINFSGNIGLQQDDLDHTKSGDNKRTVMALNLTYNPGPKLSLNMSYSNFQSFTNIKPQFQYINQLTPYENLDTLNFRQLSQNANFNVNYVIGKNKKKPSNLNINLSFQDSYDMQGGIIGRGNASDFYNLSSAYSFSNMDKLLSISTALNVTYNTIGISNTITYGPTISVNKQLLNKKLRTGLSLSYNRSADSGAFLNNVSIARVNAGYVLHKKHNINLSAISMFRKSKSQPNIHDMTATLGYSYNF